MGGPNVTFQALEMLKPSLHLNAFFCPIYMTNKIWLGSTCMACLRCIHQCMNWPMPVIEVKDRYQ